MSDHAIPAPPEPQALRRIPPDLAESLGQVLARAAHDLRGPLSGLSLDLFSLETLLETASTGPGEPAQRLESLLGRLAEICDNLNVVFERAVVQVDNVSALGDALLTLHAPAPSPAREAPL